MTEKSSKLRNNCIVCKKSGQKYTSPSTSLHSFPSCKVRRRIWIEFCGLTDQEVLPLSKICSFHFKPTCFKPKLKRRLLQSYAIPTIFVKDCVKKTNMPIKKNEGKPKYCKINDVLQQIRSVRDGSAKSIKFLSYSPNEILSEGKCETCDVHYKATKKIDAILSNICNKRLKEINKKKKEL